MSAALSHQPLKGQIAVVTGGGRGIGRSIALALADAGADVCVTARSNDQLLEVVAGIEEHGRRGLAVNCDVSDRVAVEAMIDTVIQKLGRLDILVNNAGGGLERTKVGDDDPDNWVRVVEINLFGTYYCSRAALPHLKASGNGRIINIGSGMGHEARATNSSYNVSKAGVWMLTRSMALQLADEGVTVNELVPGPVATELTAGVFEAGKKHPAMPTEFVKGPNDVVPLAMMLATQEPTGPTGQSFSLARRPIV